MKRLRSDPVSGSTRDSQSDQSGGDDSDSLASRKEKQEAQFANSSEVSSEESQVDFGEDPSRDPLVPLLAEALAAMRSGETFGETLNRVAKALPLKLPRLTEVHAELLKQHDLVLMNMKREAVLLRAMSEAAKLQTALPAAWQLRWRAAPDSAHGPFSSDEMQAWAANGYFEKKAADVKNLNAHGSSWVPAADRFPVPKPREPQARERTA